MTGAFDDRFDELNSPKKKKKKKKSLSLAEGDNGDDGDDDDERRQEEELRPHQSGTIQELKEKMRRLKERRRSIAATRKENESLTRRWQEHVHDLTKQQELACADLLAWKLRHRHASKHLEESYLWNVINDAFYIVPQGPFATINGVRLGSEAVVTSSSSPQEERSSAGGGQQQQQAQAGMASSAFDVMAATVSLPGRYLGFGGGAGESNLSASSAPVATTSQTDQHPNDPSAAATATTTVTKIRVPWTEINSALGQIALLLSILEQTPHAGIHFPHHAIFPQGSTSKIGLRQPNAITGHSRRTKENPIVATYHLYSDDSFQLFGKRNFNLALRALTECLSIAAKAIAQRDRTIVMPFEMQVEHDNPSAPCTVGGLPVQYTADHGTQWTRVVKYMLINVKWCVAYTAKHVDR